MAAVIDGAKRHNGGKANVPPWVLTSRCYRYRYWFGDLRLQSYRNRGA